MQQCSFNEMRLLFSGVRFLARTASGHNPIPLFRSLNRGGGGLEEQGGTRGETHRQRDTHEQTRADAEKRKICGEEEEIAL